MEETFLDRLIKEKEELEDKHNKLLSFIQSEKFDTIEITQQTLLMTQFDIMSEYLDILKQRLQNLNSWEKYRRINLTELRPYVPLETLEGVSISEVDSYNGSPKLGDMIARNPLNHKDQWLIAKEYFIQNFEKI